MMTRNRQPQLFDRENQTRAVKTTTHRPLLRKSYQISHTVKNFQKSHVEEFLPKGPTR